VPLAHGPLQRIVQQFRRDLAFFEIDLHQLFVDLDHLVHELAVRFLDRGKIGLARGREEAIGYPRRAAGGEIQRQAFLAERRLDVLQQHGQVDVFCVDLVDDDQAVEAAPCRPVHEAAGHHLDAVLRVDHDGRGFDRGKRRKRVAQEIGVAGRVEQVDPAAAVRPLGLEARHRELERVPEGLLARGVVAHGSAALDAAGGGDYPRAREQRLGKRGLAGPRLADERDRPDLFDGMLAHGSLQDAVPGVCGALGAIYSSIRARAGSPSARPEPRARPTTAMR